MLNLGVDAARAQQGDEPTLEDMEEFCRQAWEIVAAVRRPTWEQKDGNGVADQQGVPPRRF